MLEGIQSGTRLRPAEPVTRPRAWRFWAALAFQVAVVASVPVPQLFALYTGTEVVLRMRPVDPVDLLRGRYVRLGYEIGDPARLRALPGWQPTFLRGSQTLYWTLRPGTSGQAWEAVAIAPERPRHPSTGTVVLEGHLQNGRATFGTEEYYLPDQRGVALQAALGAAHQGLAHIKVDAQGHAVLSNVEVGGQRY